MGTVKVNLKNGDAIEEIVSDAQDKIELKDRLMQDDIRAQFVDATVEYDGGGVTDGHTHRFTDFDELVKELGKFGG